MRVLVTGATGFLGSELIPILRRAGHEVLGVSRAAAGDDLQPLDVTMRDECRRTMSRSRIDAVVHAAGLAHVPRRPAMREECRRVNVEGTRNVLEISLEAGVGIFVYVSSVSVYGQPESNREPPPTEEDPVRPSELYGLSKADAEQIVLTRQHEATVCVLRMATMYGGEWLTNIRKRVAPPGIGRVAYIRVDASSPRHTLCSRTNASRAIQWALEGRLSEQIYNVADQYRYSQDEILSAVSRIEGRKLRLTIPEVLPRTVYLASRGLPTPLRTLVRHQYWKYCGRNLYSTERLESAGFDAPPDLLALGRS